MLIRIFVLKFFILQVQVELKLKKKKKMETAKGRNGNRRAIGKNQCHMDLSSISLGQNSGIARLF